MKTGTSLGVEKVRLAVPDFKASSTDPQDAALLKTFNDTLWNDLDVSGIVELVSKSFYPLQVPGQPPEDAATQAGIDQADALLTACREHAPSRLTYRLAAHRCSHGGTARSHLGALRY